MTKKLYTHFNPEVHKIESKIATVRTSHHCKYPRNPLISGMPKIFDFCAQHQLPHYLDSEIQEANIDWKGC